MTARQPPRPNGLNAEGTGRGLKKVTKPLAKKRGASADRGEVVLDNRRKYTSATNIPVAEIAERIDPNKPLTDKAKAFVKFWAQGESITSASAKAGYGDGATYAYKLVHFPQAIALYQKEKALYEEAAQMTRKKVMDGFLEAAEMARMLGDPTALTGAWREVAKMCGYYEPVKRTLDVNINDARVMKNMNKLSDAELLKMIQEGAAQDLQQIEHDDGEPE